MRKIKILNISKNLNENKSPENKVKIEDEPDVNEDEPDVKTEDEPDVKTEDEPDVKTEEEFNKLVDEFNNITRQLNNCYTSQNKYRQYRENLRKKILNSQYFDPDKKYFLLPLVKPDFYISYNTAIVGNSKSLLYYNLGKEIDSHQDVFRFNFFTTRGLEKYCGNKISIYIASYVSLSCEKPPEFPENMQNIDYAIANKLKNIGFLCFYKHFVQLSKIKSLFKENCSGNGNKLYTIHWDSNYFRNVSEYYGLKISKDPQCGTGIMLMLIDIGLCPDVYGFDTKYCDDNYYYYWDTDTKKCDALSVSHNYNWEFNILNMLSKNNYINLKTYNQ